MENNAERSPVNYQIDLQMRATLFHTNFRSDFSSILMLNNRLYFIFQELLELCDRRVERPIQVKTCSFLLINEFLASLPGISKGIEIFSKVISRILTACESHFHLKY